MSTEIVMLTDNGSRSALATLNLRRMAKLLSERIGRSVHPISLQHSDRIDVQRLKGEPAALFTAFMREQLELGNRSFQLLPLFFGKSKALTAFIPQQLELLHEEFGEFSFRLADELVPLPNGETRLAAVLRDNVVQTCLPNPIDHQTVILTDHGSPLPAVTAVRSHLARVLSSQLPEGVVLKEAVMERRPGVEYDFAGQLLQEMLEECAVGEPERPIIVSMLFISPGRHAGPEGDIETIVNEVRSRHPQVSISITALVGDHSGLIDILADRFNG